MEVPGWGLSRIVLLFSCSFARSCDCYRCDLLRGYAWLYPSTTIPCFPHRFHGGFDFVRKKWVALYMPSTINDNLIHSPSHRPLAMLFLSRSCVQFAL